MTPSPPPIFVHGFGACIINQAAATQLFHRTFLGRRACTLLLYRAALFGTVDASHRLHRERSFTSKDVRAAPRRLFNVARHAAVPGSCMYHSFALCRPKPRTSFAASSIAATNATNAHYLFSLPKPNVLVLFGGGIPNVHGHSQRPCVRVGLCFVVHLRCVAHQPG